MKVNVYNEDIIFNRIRYEIINDNAVYTEYYWEFFSNKNYDIDLPIGFGLADQIEFTQFLFDKLTELEKIMLL